MDERTGGVTKRRGALRDAIKSTSIGTLVLAAGLVAAISALCAFALVRENPRPQELARSSTNGAINAVTQNFDDKRQVELLPEVGSEFKAIIGVSGTITNSTCRAGNRFRSGTAIVEIDGKPYVAIATATPFWRDFKRGIKGKDVLSFQEALLRAGYRLPKTARFDRATTEAAREYLSKAGLKWKGSSLPRTHLIWLPARNQAVQSCLVSVGQQVTAGSAIATLTPEIASVRIRTLPTQLVPGDRILSLGEIRFRVDPTGRLTEAKDLGRLQSQPEYATWLQSGGKVALMASYSLKTAIPVASVPAAAIVFSQGGDACVYSPTDVMYPVSIVGSSLGRSLITWKSIQTTGLTIQTQPDADLQCE